ncbi:glycoside hydrolase superfamily [Dissophora ornata]|nr:glycoside hydrolase superfamily [Dissophora ornata]
MCFTRLTMSPHILPPIFTHHRGKYDVDYFEYLVKVFHKCKQYGFKCFIDPHQDVWSRFSGGSGAPLWTLYLAGLDPSCFPQTNAALVHNLYEDPENFPKMVWATNYNKLAAATMFTLFFAGSTFAPDCIVDQMNIQDYLQTHYIKSYMALAEYITAQNGIEDDVVIGYDTLNEPSAGWVGTEDVTKFPHHQELKKDSTPTPLQAMLLGQGFKQTVEFWVTTFFGPKRKGSKTIDPEGVTAWLSKEKRDEKDKRFGWKRSSNFPEADKCIWAHHGVWDISTQQVLEPEYFSKDPQTGEKYDFDTRSFLPFCRRYAQAIRTIHKAAIIFLEPPVNELPPSLPPPHDDDDVAHFDITSRVVYAPHWYDGLTLLNKRWNFFNVDYLGVKRGRYPNYAAAVKIGEKAIKECFRTQLAYIKEEGQEAIGMHPTLIGEIGIPYDMNDGKSYKPNGNYKDQIKAMDANMYALESNHLNFTLWNYCPDNSHKWGDQWNGEDLSLWCKDDLDRDPRRLTKKSSQASFSSDSFSLHKVGSDNTMAPSSGVQDQAPTATAPMSSSVLSNLKESPVHLSVPQLSSASPSSSFSSSSKSLSSSASSDQRLLQDSGSTPDSKFPHPDLGGRAVLAFCRPFAQKVAGIPLELSFSLKTVTFKFSFRRTRMVEPGDASNPLNSPRPGKITQPTVIYLPRMHFPCAEEYLSSLEPAAAQQSKKDAACSVTVSGGHWKWGDDGQHLYWWTDDDDNDESEDGPSEGSKWRNAEDDDNDVFEITVVGKKWSGNSLDSNRSGSGGGFWSAISQCCRIS